MKKSTQVRILLGSELFYNVILAHFKNTLILVVFFFSAFSVAASSSSAPPKVKWVVCPVGALPVFGIRFSLLDLKWKQNSSRVGF